MEKKEKNKEKELEEKTKDEEKTTEATSTESTLNESEADEKDVSEMTKETINIINIFKEQRQNLITIRREFRKRETIYMH